MECRETEIPAIAAEFKNSNFVVNKTNRAFSSLPIDQAHEQNNKIVKGKGGAIGLTESSTQLLRWMVSGPGNIKNNQPFQIVPGICPEYSETRRVRRFTPLRANERGPKHFSESSERSL